MNFLEKLSKFIVKGRWYFFAIFIALTIACTCIIHLVAINYDLTKYLPDSSPTKIALQTMEDEFGASGTASIMIENCTQSQALELKSKIENIEGVATVICDVTSQNYFNNNNALLQVFFSHSDHDQETAQALEDIRNTCHEYEIALAGSAVDASNSTKAIGSEMLIILAIAIAIVLLILTLTSKSWLEPLVYLCVIGCAILMNMGTNLILGEISFITQSISAIMLIALEMDYCIVLCSRFREEQTKGLAPKEAMTKALQGSFKSILASSLTVMAGLIALMFMDFSIGFDIGAVLAKGVFISILAVIFFMPSIILIFSKLLTKTSHKSFLPKMDKVGTFASKTKIALPIVFLCLVVTAVVFQAGLQFSYVAKFSQEGSQSQIECQQIEENFGKQNSLVVIIPNKDAENEKILYNNIINIEVDGKKYINAQSAIVDTPLYAIMTKEILQAQFGLTIEQATSILMAITQGQDKVVYAIDVIKFLQANPNLVPPAQVETVKGLQFLAQKAESLFCSENYHRMIFNLNLAIDDEKAILFIEKLNNVLNESTFDTYFVANNTSNLIETQDIFKTDRLKTDLITFFAILMIILLAFRSFSVPILLVLTIQGAIWINCAISAIAGESVFFVCYLLAMAIQMGATIDYGILLTDRYINFRRKYDKLTSLKKALNASITTILTSGLILLFAAFTIHFVSSIPIISEIGLLIGRGTLISIIAVLFILPQLLLLFDKLIEKTTFRQKFFVPVNAIETNEETTNNANIIQKEENSSEIVETILESDNNTNNDNEININNKEISTNFAKENNTKNKHKKIKNKHKNNNVQE